jgi:CheY-like chemotaxis protein
MLRILVIEDSPVNMALTVAILENAGHAVLQADHARAGLDLARRTRPDLAGCDGYVTKPISTRSSWPRSTR